MSCARSCKRSMKRCTDNHAERRPVRTAYEQHPICQASMITYLVLRNGVFFNAKRSSQSAPYARAQEDCDRALLWSTAATAGSRQSCRACRLRSAGSRPFRLLEQVVFIILSNFLGTLHFCRLVRGQTIIYPSWPSSLFPSAPCGQPELRPSAWQLPFPPCCWWKQQTLQTQRGRGRWSFR